MKVKLDKYTVYSKAKKREYKILIFPAEENMWAYDDFPEMDMLLVDGNKDAYKALKLAYGILAQFPEIIIYFPIRKVTGKKGAFWNSHDLVLMRPELQFRRSEWYSLKEKLDKKHLERRFVFDYDRKRLQDYFYKRKVSWDYEKWRKKAEQKYLAEIVGDTLFMVVPQLICFENHNAICELMDSYKAGAWNPDSCYRVGWLFSDYQLKEIVKNMS